MKHVCCIFSISQCHNSHLIARLSHCTAHNPQLTLHNAHASGQKMQDRNKNKMTINCKFLGGRNSVGKTNDRLANQGISARPMKGWENVKGENIFGGPGAPPTPPGSLQLVFKIYFPPQLLYHNSKAEFEK